MADNSFKGDVKLMADGLAEGLTGAAKTVAEIAGVGASSVINAFGPSHAAKVDADRSKSESKRPGI